MLEHEGDNTLQFSFPAAYLLIGLQTEFSFLNMINVMTMKII